MRLEWRNDLAIGIKEIDEQHMELFSRFDRLLVACTNSEPDYSTLNSSIPTFPMLEETPDQ